MAGRFSMCNHWIANPYNLYDGLSTFDLASYDAAGFSHMAVYPL